MVAMERDQMTRRVNAPCHGTPLAIARNKPINYSDNIMTLQANHTEYLDKLLSISLTHHKLIDISLLYDTAIIIDSSPEDAEEAIAKLFKHITHRSDPNRSQWLFNHFIALYPEHADYLKILLTFQ